jgi:hypothetical protein
MVSAVKAVDWKQLGMDFKVFGRRFFTGDFSLIKPETHEQPAVAAHPPRMASLIVWRRALLFMACVLSVALLIKTCFDPHTFRGVYYDSQVETLQKQNPSAGKDEIRKAATESTDEFIRTAGESNVGIIDGILIGAWLTLIASFVFQLLAAKHWRDWKRSRKFALWAVGVILLPQLAAMLIPWAAMMDFKHLEGEFAAQGLDGAAGAGQVRMALQFLLVFALLGAAIPFFFGLFNGVLRASLATKTLVPSSIVCGWGTLLLALTIAVPWFMVLSVVDQFQADALVFIGVLCLLAAPLSLVFKSRRLGTPLASTEASSLVKRARLLLSGLNLAGVLLLVIYLSEKDILNTGQIVTGVLQYFANLMIITVVAVDLLVLLLDRAHRKLANDTAPEEPLRQLGEVLPRA